MAVLTKVISWSFKISNLCLKCEKRLKFNIVASNGNKRVIRCACHMVVCSLNMVGRRAKQSEIWDSARLVTDIWGTFDFIAFKVIS